MTVSRKMLEIIRSECENIAGEDNARYDGYAHDLFELIADVAMLEATHSQSRIKVVQSIASKIDAATEILLKHEPDERDGK